MTAAPIPSPPAAGQTLTTGITGFDDLTITAEGDAEVSDLGGDLDAGDFVFAAATAADDDGM